MPEEEKEPPLEVFWDTLRGLRPPTEPVHTAPTLRDLADPNDMVIGTSANRILVIIKPNGELVFGPDYTPEEATLVFWEYMGRRRLQMEESLLVIQHMEAVMVRLGRADIECERLRLLAASEENPILKAERTQQAEIAMARLNMVAHEAIELGRGLARRDEALPPVPERIPAPIQNPDSQYRGREGLPP